MRLTVCVLALVFSGGGPAAHVSAVHEGSNAAGAALTGAFDAQSSTVLADCSAEGDATATTRSDPDLNTQKNRETMPDDGFTPEHFDALADLDVPEGVSKKHRSAWPDSARKAVEQEEQRAVQVVGYLLAVKLEGPESPNCHSDDPSERDFHLWLANSPDDEKSDAMVVEITPRVRGEHKAWTRPAIARLVKDQTRVRISGWVLMDPEHPDQVGKTRHTLWEIHPIMRIEFLTAGKWREL